MQHTPPGSSGTAYTRRENLEHLALDPIKGRVAAFPAKIAGAPRNGSRPSASNSPCRPSARFRVNVESGLAPGEGGSRKQSFQNIIFEARMLSVSRGRPLNMKAGPYHRWELESDTIQTNQSISRLIKEE